MLRRPAIHAVLFSIIMLAASMSCSGQQKTEITTFLLVRHAEKGSDGTNDPDLTEQGRRRADALTKLFSKHSIDALYTTDYKRTRHTLKPLAESRQLPVRSYEAFKVDVLDRMLEAHHGGTVVVCGHSNNIPWIANVLTGTERYKDFAETDYDNILIVSVAERGKIAHVTWLTFSME